MQAVMPPEAAVHVLGARVQSLNVTRLNDIVAAGIEGDEHWVIAHQNLHSVALQQSDPLLRGFYDAADFIHIDGMALVLLGRLLGFPFEREHRVTYVDWIDPLMSMAAERNWRVFYLGSKPGVAEAGLKRLQNRHGHFRVGAQHGYFREDDRAANQYIVKRIAEFRPQLLLVGMGMPRQERWILHHRAELDANVILPCGACIDYVAGVLPTPPRWMGRIGLEWLYRLLSEPGRLSRRYLIEPWPLLPLLFHELTSPRREVRHRAAGDR